MPLAVVCPVHGPQMFAAIEIQNSYMAEIQGTGFCPLCHRPSPITRGVFNFDSAGNPHVVSAPEWSRAALRALQDRLEKLRRDAAQDSGVSDEEVARQVDLVKVSLIEQDLSPFADMLDSSLPRTQVRQILKQIIVTLKIYGGDADWVDKAIARLKQLFPYLF